MFDIEQYTETFVTRCVLLPCCHHIPMYTYIYTHINNEAYFNRSYARLFFHSHSKQYPFFLFLICFLLLFLSSRRVCFSLHSYSLLLSVSFVGLGSLFPPPTHHHLNCVCCCFFLFQTSLYHPFHPKTSKLNVQIIILFSCSMFMFSDIVVDVDVDADVKVAAARAFFFSGTAVVAYCSIQYRVQFSMLACYCSSSSSII